MKILLIVLLCSCSQWSGWSEVPTAQVTAEVQESTQEFQDAWINKVSSDTDSWNQALISIGCPPAFEVIDGGKPIILVGFDTWSDNSPVSGVTDTSRIRIRSSKDQGVMMDNPSVLLHELGHTFGLEHADPKWGPSILLTPPSRTIQPRDVEAAACRIGCGPCNEGADPYDK